MGLVLGLLAGACACLNAAPAWADDAATAPADYTALVLGHAFLPQPDATYMQEVIDTYVDPTSHIQRRTDVQHRRLTRQRVHPRDRLRLRAHPRCRRPGPGDQPAARRGQRQPRHRRLLDEHLDRDARNDQSRRHCRRRTRHGWSEVRLGRGCEQPQRRNLHAFAGYRRGDPSGDPGGHPVHHRHLQHRIQRGFRLPAVRQQHLRRPQRRRRLRRPASLPTDRLAGVFQPRRARRRRGATHVRRGRRHHLLPDSHPGSAVAGGAA